LKHQRLLSYTRRGLSIRRGIGSPWDRAPAPADKAPEIAPPPRAPVARKGKPAHALFRCRAEAHAACCGQTGCLPPAHDSVKTGIILQKIDKTMKPRYIIDILISYLFIRERV